MVEALGPDPGAVAGSIEAGLSPQDKAKLAAGTPADWANESFSVAAKEIYARIPSRGPVRLPRDYARREKAVVRLQLARAGIRSGDAAERDLSLRPQDPASFGLVCSCTKFCDAHLLDQADLGLQPVDMFFFAFQDIHEQFAADIILDVLAMRDRIFEIGQGARLQREIAADHFAHVFADHQLAEILQIGKPAQEQARA